MKLFRNLVKQLFIMVLAGFAALFVFQAGLFAGADNNSEAKKQIKQIEEAESLDQELGVTEGVKPKPVKKEANPEYLEEQFQPRQGFQQDPTVVAVDRR